MVRSYQCFMIGSGSLAGTQLTLPTSSQILSHNFQRKMCGC